MVKLIEVGWGEPNSAFVQMFTSQFFPDATPVQAEAFNEMQRMATTPQRAAKLAAAFGSLDASEYLARIACPTLVLHCTGDARAPFDEGRYIAGTIPGARFQSLESRNHLPLAGEPAFDRAFEAIEAFLPSDSMRAEPAFPSLTRRERAILDHIAQGLDNAQIAARLESPRRPCATTSPRSSPSWRSRTAPRPSYAPAKPGSVPCREDLVPLGTRVPHFPVSAGVRVPRTGTAAPGRGADRQGQMGS
jgi:hypothetical protein